MVGPDCSGVTTAVLETVAVPDGVLMVSPAATSPALSDVADQGLLFRTAPSDARQGEVMSDILAGRSIESVALTYTANHYGKGLAESFQTAFEAAGGRITLNAQHEDERADYSAEVAALAAAGSEVLVVIGYVDQGRASLLRAAIDSGAFSRFALSDAMWGDKLMNTFGAELDGSVGQRAGSEDRAADAFAELAGTAGLNGRSTFTGESYDAAALIGLAMQAAGSADAVQFKGKVMEIANAPGAKIGPGELGKALQILAQSGDIDDQGASAVDLIGSGESAGHFAEREVKGGRMETVGYR